MKIVAKYNLFKGVSTGLTMGTPIITLACCGDLFVHRSDTAISAAGIFAILVSILLFKDKILENWKMPSAFITSIVLFIAIIMVERILLPIKCVCIATIAATGIDEFTFKRIYKDTELLLPKEAESYKHVGFLFTSTKKLQSIANKFGGN